MQRRELIVALLALVCLIGVIVLLVISKSVMVLMPVLTVLIGYLVGKKEDILLGLFKKKQ